MTIEYGSLFSVSSQDNVREHATIIVSRSAGRYRVQGTSLGAIGPLLSTLKFRLQAHFGAMGSGDKKAAAKKKKKDGEGALSLSVPASDLPVDAFFGDVHVQLHVRRAYASACANAERLSRQAMELQKRCIVALREKDAKPLDTLELLLRMTDKDMMQACRAASLAQKVVGCAALRLCVSVQAFSAVGVLLSGAAWASSYGNQPAEGGGVSEGTGDVDVFTRMLRLVGGGAFVADGDQSVLGHVLGAGHGHGDVSWFCGPAPEQLDAAVTFLLRSLIAVMEEGGSGRSGARMPLASVRSDDAIPTAPPTRVIPATPAKLRRHMLLLLTVLHKWYGVKASL